MCIQSVIPLRHLSFESTAKAEITRRPASHEIFRHGQRFENHATCHAIILRAASSRKFQPSASRISRHGPLAKMTKHAVLCTMQWGLPAVASLNIPWELQKLFSLRTRFLRSPGAAPRSKTSLSGELARTYCLHQQLVDQPQPPIFRHLNCDWHSDALRVGQLDLLQRAFFIEGELNLADVGDAHPFK